MILKFLQQYKEAFGDAAPLPIAFGYSYTAATESHKVPRCVIGAIRKVCHGEALTLTADNVLCGGGSLYTRFAPMQERISLFVSETEHYKQTPEQVKEYIRNLNISLTEKPYLNFIRWAFYDNNADNAVCTKFASGCCSIVTFAVQENQKQGRSCFIGMLDPSARLLVPANELTFVIPNNRFHEMMQTMEQSALFHKAYSIVKKRINGEIGK